jgi:hypothetical protein
MNAPFLACVLRSYQHCIGNSQPRWILAALGDFDLDPAAADPRPWSCAHTSWTAGAAHRLGREFISCDLTYRGGGS